MLRLIEILRELMHNLMPEKPKVKVLLTEWDKELEELREFAQQENIRYRPESLDTLVSLTKFSAKEIKLIYRGFKENCPSGVVSRSHFKEMFYHFFVFGNPDFYADYVFETFDLDKNGHINFDEFVQCLSVISRGTERERIEWIFELYDIERNNEITVFELRHIIQAISAMVGDDAVPPSSPDIIEQHTQEIFNKLDLDQDGVISREDFVSACSMDPTIIQSISVFQTVFYSNLREHHSTS